MSKLALLDPTKTGKQAEDLENRLHHFVVGRVEAIHQIVRAYQTHVAGLSPIGRPIGNFLFLGPTGSGKTRLVEATAELQPKLLRVIQERRFKPLGGAATIHADVRVICATHRNLVDLAGKRDFRADLFYRLSVFPIELPPLRERPEDIRLLVHHFAMNYAARMNKRITAISEEFMTALVCHSWPGNVRELQNFIERSVILSTGAELSGSLPEVTGTLHPRL